MALVIDVVEAEFAAMSDLSMGHSHWLQSSHASLSLRSHGSLMSFHNKSVTMLNIVLHHVPPSDLYDAHLK